MRWTVLFGTALLVVGCTDTEVPTAPDSEALAPQLAAGGGGATTANGWYEEEEIYYVLLGVEEGVTQRGENDLYLIGGDRVYQANVAEFIPGEAGYTPHWNVNMVNTAAGKTLADILASSYVSAHYPEALFDDVEDILDILESGKGVSMAADRYLDECIAKAKSWS